MRSACALRIISGKIILFVVPKRLRAFRNYFFTGGVCSLPGGELSRSDKRGSGWRVAPDEGYR